MAEPPLKDAVDDRLVGPTSPIGLDAVAATTDRESAGAGPRGPAGGATAGVSSAPAGHSGWRRWGGSRLASRPGRDRAAATAPAATGPAAHVGTLERWSHDLLADLQLGGRDGLDP